LQATITQVGAMPDEVITHLDRGPDCAGTRALLEAFGLQARSPARAGPPPVQAGKRWVVEQTHA
jgi:hypothetical protein